MFRKHRAAIVWTLVVAMGVSPSLVYAQPPATPPTGGAKAKPDLGYVTPETVAAAVLYPRRVLMAPEMEMLPTEVISAGGMKELGFDPLEIEQALVIAEPPIGGPPRGGIVLHMAGPVANGKLFPQLWERTVAAELDGHAYRQATAVMDLSIFQPDDRTIILAHDELLRRMVSNHAKPQAGEMSRVLDGMAEQADIFAVVLAERLRPLMQLGLMSAPLPKPLYGLANVPELLYSVQAKANLIGEGGMSLSVRARDAPAAVELEKIIDQASDFARQSALAEIAKEEKSRDPVDQAGAKYGRRMMERMLKLLRPVRKGDTLTLATKQGGNAQVQVATIGILVALLLPAVQAAREAARRMASQNNLKRIALAMLNYESAHKTFPPAYKADDNGKPLLSWRVLILPYIEGGNGLYERFHLDEPWDSPHNKKLISQMPAVYKSPSSAVSAQGKTNYLTVRGDKSVFPGDEGVKLADITDGTSNTIMTVEASDEQAVIWTKPDDFQYDPKNPMKGLIGLHPGGFIVGFADGSVRFLSATLDRSTLAALFTRNGGEPVNLGD